MRGLRDGSLAHMCLSVCVVYSDIAGDESADFTAADCSEREACIRAANKGMILEREGVERCEETKSASR